MTTDDASTQPQFVREMEAAFEVSDRGVERFYFNGFAVAAGAADATILFKQNERAVALGAVSYPMLKEFALRLLATVEQIEQGLGAEFLTAEEAGKRLLASQGKAQP